MVKFDDLIDPLGAALTEAVRDVITDATDEELTRFTVDVAGRTINLLALPDGAQKDELLTEHRGTFKVIAERHRINLADVANERLTQGLDIGIAFAQKLIRAAI